ncbi:unnamed protein product [marine sediment metagenome]|uniref:Uncharacterized protein n=1 Tax=marine sediment metagenome TaxID=412755 RepID=X1IM86_9ZZZZ
MSRYDYMQSRKIWAKDRPFYAIIMAAMSRADTDNLALLVDAFPHVFTELRQRYTAPGGWLPEDEECPLAVLEAMEKAELCP